MKDVFLQLCRILLTQIPLGDLARRVTRVIVDCRLDYRFNVDAMDLLAKHMLIQMNVYDQNLAILIDSGSNFEVFFSLSGISFGIIFSCYYSQFLH